MSRVIREPAVAGAFYPDDPQQLAAEIDTHLQQNPASPVEGARPRALIVPHAGYLYSGAVAARAYNLLRPFAADIRRVVALGPSHRYPLEGLALPDCDLFRTPLGDVAVDHRDRQRLLQLPQVRQLAEAHELEHSLEVQLPFLQRVLNEFTLLPLVVGRCHSQQVCEVLDLLWDDPDTLFLISTDLSHFHDYEDACHLDKSTSELICQLREPLMGEQACGCYPLNGLLRKLQQESLSVRLLALNNSGDTAGSRNRVVGYGAFVVS